MKMFFYPPRTSLCPLGGDVTLLENAWFNMKWYFHDTIFLQIF